MHKKYDEIMEHIDVTPKMREQILDHINKIDFSEKKQTKFLHFANIKRIAALAACLAIVLVGALMLPNLQETPRDSSVAENNEIAEVSSVETLSKTVGFPVTEPKNLPFTAEDVVYTAYWTEIAEITYTSGEKTAVYRKGVGSDDVSGDYNSYALIDQVSIDGADITLKGSGKIYTLALWTDDKFSYSLSLSDGIDKVSWTKLLQNISK